MDIFVTGTGVISAIGRGTAANLDALCSGKSGVAPITSPAGLRKKFLGGQVQLSSGELKELLGIPAKDHVHRATLLGLAAGKEAWEDRKEEHDIRTGIFFGTTIGGVDMSQELFTSANRGDVSLPYDYRLTYNTSFSTDFIARELGIKGYRCTLSTACSTAANSVLLGARLIRAGKLDRALVGGGEAITTYTINGFDSLMLYDPAPCKPFDENRAGLNLGEAGGFLVLENEKAAARSGKKKLARLTGWGNACDAYHITGSSPEGTGAVLAMQKALHRAGLQAESIDYINAHGTGTQNNDASESNAMMTVFGKKIPPFSSTKSFTGHTLAAAGGIEAIYTILALREQVLFPSLHVKTHMKDFSFRPTGPEAAAGKISHALSSSFGFGGNCTSLIFSA